jgi:hypothetical protein
MPRNFPTSYAHALLELLNQLFQRETLHPRIDLPQARQPFLQPPLRQLAVFGAKRMLFSLAAQFLDPVISEVQRVFVRKDPGGISSVGRASRSQRSRKFFWMVCDPGRLGVSVMDKLHVRQSFRGGESD